MKRKKTTNPIIAILSVIFTLLVLTLIIGGGLVLIGLCWPLPVVILILLLPKVNN